jgi:hypothetical protein
MMDMPIVAKQLVEETKSGEIYPILQIKMMHKLLET